MMLRQLNPVVPLAFLLGMILFPATLSAQSLQYVRFTASIGSLSDTENYAGFDASATNAYDSGIDSPEPPAPVGDYVRLAFNPMANAPETYTEFRTDWRTPVADPLVTTTQWTFFVTTTFDTGQVTLTVDLGPELAQNAPVFLWDGGLFHDLRATSSLAWSAVANLRKRFTLYIGSPGKPFIEMLGPSPDEEVPADEPLEFSWTVASSVSIQRTLAEVSLDGGDEFTVLTQVDSLLTSFGWTSPDTGVSSAVFQVEVTDSLGQVASSSVAFVVLDPTSELTGVHLITPGSGSVLNGGDTVLVDWEWEGGLSNVLGAVLQVSCDEGNTWTTEFTTSDTVSEKQWTVPDGVFTNDAILKIVSLISTGTVQQDSVDTITLRPTVLQNRSFEEWGRFGEIVGPPDDWSTAGAAYGSAMTVKAKLTGLFVADGLIAAQVDLGSSVSASLFQEITDVTVGNQYTFTAKIYDDSPTTSASLRVTALNSSNTLITAYGSSSSEDQSAHAELSVALIAPSGTKALRLEILLSSSLAGTLYLDDVRLVGAEPNPEITLLGPPQDTVLTYDGVTTLPIRWDYGETALVVTTAKVDVSYNDGISWETVAEIPDNTTTSFSWTGTDTFSVDTRVRVTAFNSSGGEGMATSGKFVIRPTHRATVLASGWHLFSLPLTPPDPSVRAVLGDEVADAAWVYEWTEGQYQTSDTLRMLRAYWLALDQAAAVELEGDAGVGQVEVSLDPGWILLSNPFPASLLIDSLLFVRSETEKRFGQAVSAGWVAGQLYDYDSQAGSYSPLSSGSYLAPFHACWMGTLMDATRLRVNPPHLAVPEGAGASSRSEQESDSSLWTAPVVLRTNRGISRLITVGFAASASDGFDPDLDLPAPPDDPGGGSPRLLIDGSSHPLATGKWFYRDICPLPDPGETRQWNFRIQPGMEERVDLDFRDLDAVLSANQRASLVFNGEVLPLHESLLIHWDGSRDQSIFSLILETLVPDEMTPPLPTRFEILSAWPNPFNRAITLELSLPVSSNLKLEVFDVLGRQVVQRSLGKRDAGVFKLQWEPDVASGMYLLRLSSNTGEYSVRRVILLR